MTKTAPITAIFKRNLYFSELIKLLKQEGIGDITKKDHSSMETTLSRKGIVLLEIDSEKILKRLHSHLKKINRHCKVLCILKDDFRIPDMIEKIRSISQPIVFNEILKTILNLNKSLNMSQESINFRNLIYYPKSSELIDKNSDKAITLTDLENKLIKFIINKKNGATKSDLLVNVWKYKTDLNTHTLESLIYRLRKKIEKDPNNPQILVQIDKKYFLKIST